MTWAEWILAAWILTHGGQGDGLSLDGATYYAVRGPMIALSIEWEIFDVRETQYILADAKDFATDVAILRKRERELRDAPRLVDTLRLPDRGDINALIMFNRAYRAYLEDWRCIDPPRAGEIHYVIREVDYLYTVWDAARDASCDYYFVQVRRHALKKLRDMLPEGDYYAGRLPPPAPFWRFKVIP